MDLIKRRLTSDEAAIGTVEILIGLLFIVTVAYLLYNRLSAAIGKKTVEVERALNSSNTNFGGSFTSGKVTG